ncbi:hypothetical protein Dimus_037109, partial [Dionaea muscipula]
LVHVDVVKEFYAKMIVIHSKKKDIVKSKVRGIEMEFDHEKSATILGVPGTNGICEYIKEVWEESKHTKPLEIPRRFANDENIMASKKGQVERTKAFSTIYSFFGYEECGSQDHELPYGDWLTMVFEAFGVPLVDKKGEEPKRYDFFEETFLTMCKLTKENGIWWIGSGENRRRDDDVNAQEGEAVKEDEGNKDDFDWEAVIDEAAVEGESGSGERFYDAEDETQGSPEVQEEIPPPLHKAHFSRRNKTLAESTLGSY